MGGRKGSGRPTAAGARLRLSRCWWSQLQLRVRVRVRADAEAQVGVLSADERLALSLSSLRESAADVRSYLEGAEKLRTEAGVSDTTGAGAALQEALEAVEKAAGGKPLLFADAKGMASLKTALAATQTKLGLKDAKVADLAAASATEETEVAVAAMKRARDEAVAAAKARDGLAL